MVIAHHLIWTVYGTWLPNDPRGSGSRVVCTPELLALGELHFGRRKAQPSSKLIHAFYDRAEPRLIHDVHRFSTPHLSIVADALNAAISKRGYTCYACAVMPDHVHLVIRKHRDLAETMLDELQELSRERLVTMGLLPTDHPVWTTGGWKRFLDSPERIHAEIRYIENNPLEIGLAPQAWPFVKPYDDWPFHKRRRC